jgi:Caenorhabditis protein of unknown function, DUF268
MLSPLASPVRKYFDPRFRDVHTHIDTAVEHHLEPHLDDHMVRLTADVDGLHERIAALHERISGFEASVTADTQTAAEFAATFRRSTARLYEELHAIWAALGGDRGPLFEVLSRAAEGDTEAETTFAKLLHEQLPGVADRVVGASTGTELPIGPGTAEFLNWASGHTGPAGQADIWLNVPLTLLHTDGTVRTGDVNERIVELPWAMGVATTLAQGSLVLDFGSAESTLALSLASLGLDVIASDLRPYPFEHPRLRVQVGPLEHWDGPERPLDAVFCISAIEHVGLGAYGEDPSSDGDLDRIIIERFAGWLRPGGELVLTAPFGTWQVDELQRVYDRDHLGALLHGWTVLDEVVCVQTGHDRWERIDGDPAGDLWDDGKRGVVLVRATPAE